jgi:hypothetical protein
MKDGFILGALAAALVGCLVISAFDAIDKAHVLSVFTENCEGIGGEVVLTPRGHACIEKLVIISRRLP